jgi:hypothetical protein
LFWFRIFIKCNSLYLKKQWIDYFTDGSFEALSKRKILATEKIPTIEQPTPIEAQSTGFYYFKDALLSSKPIGTHQKYLWNEISISYTLNGNNCIISLPFNFDVKNIKSSDKRYIYINGSGYLSNIDIDVILFKPLIKAKLLPEDFMSYN